MRKAFSEILATLRSDDENNIQKALTAVMRFFGVDRAFVGYFVDEGHAMSFTHEVASEGIQAIPEEFYQQLYSTQLPWWADKLRRNEVIVVDNVSLMQEEAIVEKRIMSDINIQSQITAPTYFDNRLNGFIGLDYINTLHSWDELEIENLRLFADLLSLAIEQERTAEELKHSSREAFKTEAKFRIIFDRLPWGVEIYDENGVLTDMNPKALEIFGTTKEQILGINLFDNPVIPPENKALIRKGEEIIMEDDYTFDSVHNIGYFNTEIKQVVKHLWGKCIPLKDEQNEIFGYLFLENDITDEYRRQEEIQSNLAKLQTAVDTGEAFIWDYNLKTGELTVDFGQQETHIYTKEVVNFNKDNTRGMNAFFASIHPDDYDRVVNQGFLPLYRGESDSYSSTFRRFIDGKTIWYTCNVRTYKYDEEGNPLRIVSYMANTTKYHENEIELIKIKETDKLKSAFMANMSHEIRTPLNAIVGFSNILAELCRSEETNELADLINKNNDLLLRLVNDILDFSKLESGELEYSIDTFDFRELYLALSEEYLCRATDQICFVYDQESPSFLITSDSKRIHQVIVNLLNNAFKFTKRGKISFLYEITEENQLYIRVSDTGIGLPEQEGDRVFDNFFKGDVFQQGVGLGLPISKMIIEALGGHIGVERNEEGGTTFWLLLPATKESRS
ncbi:PAS domain S-box protein [Parabacteroides sp. OttesenSCG-928-N08]|nr:PAS domain S-box protein [Parabacteroides sp. OttesenSCG-928-N08]